MKTTTKLAVALALVLSATGVTLAQSWPQSKPLYNSANSNDPAIAGGGSSGYNNLLIQDSGE